MKGLIIKSPHIENILDGKKVWELRGSDTKIRGRIALIKSGSKTIVGYANLVGSSGPCSPAALELSEHLHLAKGATKYKNTYAWHLEKVEKLETPISYSHPQGAIIWVKLKD